MTINVTGNREQLWSDKVIRLHIIEAGSFELVSCTVSIRVCTFNAQTQKITPYDGAKICSRMFTSYSIDSGDAYFQIQSYINKKLEQCRFDFVRDCEHKYYPQNWFDNEYKIALCAVWSAVCTARTDTAQIGKEIRITDTEYNFGDGYCFAFYGSKQVPFLDAPCDLFVPSYIDEIDLTKEQLQYHSSARETRVFAALTKAGCYERTIIAGKLTEVVGDCDEQEYELMPESYNGEQPTTEQIIQTERRTAAQKFNFYLPNTVENIKLVAALQDAKLIFMEIGGAMQAVTITTQPLELDLWQQPLDTIKLQLKRMY